MIAPLSSSAGIQKPISTKTAPSFPSRVYRVACGIFRLMTMSVQYGFMTFSILEKRWFYFSSSIANSDIKVKISNIANFEALLSCCKSAFQPIPKIVFKNIGIEQGLRITHDIIYKPASGLCLGISLVFLSKYLSIQENTTAKNLVDSAKELASGGNPTSVRLQAMYEALLGTNGSVNTLELTLFRAVLNGKPIPAKKKENRELWECVAKFMEIKNPDKSLRRFIFDELEKKGIAITPDIYSLTLEMDALWIEHCSKKEECNGPIMGKYDNIHQAILQELARCTKLAVAQGGNLSGKVDEVGSHLEKLPLGNYLITFTDHTVVMVKTSSEMAIMDPNKGLAIFEERKQTTALSRLLQYYGSEDRVDLKVYSITLN